MDRKIIIEKNALTMQLAIIQNNVFTDYYVNALFETDLQNKIVIGQVMQVVKNLKAAFVDYGDIRNGMLHFKQIPDGLMHKVQPGSRMAVQIVKQNIGEKGHKLTAKLNVSGRYLVCLPFEPGINISKKITDQSRRKAIKEALLTLDNPQGFGFIVRTSSKNVAASELIEDANKLIAQVSSMLATKDYLAKGNVLYEEMDVTKQLILEKLSGKEAYEVICNDKAYLECIQAELRGYPIHLETTFTHYEGDLSIWSCYGLGKKIEALLRRKIWLKNGGNLVIDYTEAMTIVDVNSAKAIMTKNPERAVLELNKEAVQATILQILRRNLSGMIIVDLVEMKDPLHKKEVYEYAKILIDAYEDHRMKVYPLTELGLLQFARTKKYQCIPHQLLENCSECYLPYAKKSFLYEMMLLEEKAKQVQLLEAKQRIYLEVSPEYAEKMQQMNIIHSLETAYNVQFQVKKVVLEKNKNILCQFYSK